MTFSKKLAFIWRLSLKRKVWLLACFFSSIVCLFVVYVVPSRHINYFLGNSLENRQLSVLVTPHQLLQARQLALLMRSVANNVPWPCKCLAQALSVKWLLRIQGIPSVTYLGAMFCASEADKNNRLNDMKAHAWVSVGPSIVIGRSNDKYAVVGTFASFVSSNN